MDTASALRKIAALAIWATAIGAVYEASREYGGRMYRAPLTGAAIMAGYASLIWASGELAKPVELAGAGQLDDNAGAPGFTGGD